MRHSFQTNFINIARPEHADFSLIKVNIIRDNKTCNNTDTKIVVKTSEGSDNNPV